MSGCTPGNLGSWSKFPSGTQLSKQTIPEFCQFSQFEEYSDALLIIQCCILLCEGWELHLYYLTNKCPACYLNYISWHIQMLLLLSSLILVYHRLVYNWSQLDLVLSVFMWISLRGMANSCSVTQCVCGEKWVSLWVNILGSCGGCRPVFIPYRAGPTVPLTSTLHHCQVFWEPCFQKVRDMKSCQVIHSGIIWGDLARRTESSGERWWFPNSWRTMLEVKWILCSQKLQLPVRWWKSLEGKFGT